MVEYITNLTNNLIGTRNYDDLRERLPDDHMFLQHVMLDLKTCFVVELNYKALGRIMCSLTNDEVGVIPDQMRAAIRYNGDCSEVLRDLVSFCLAHVILHRLSDDRPKGIPGWTRRAQIKKATHEVVDEEEAHDI
jgi:hypothetical protein